MEEVIRKMRSKKIIAFHSIVVPVDGSTDMITGSIFINTDDNDEITIFQATVPISRSDFQTRFAALETALNETWFQMPVNVEYKP